MYLHSTLRPQEYSHNLELPPYTWYFCRNTNRLCSFVNVFALNTSLKSHVFRQRVLAAIHLSSTKIWYSGIGLISWTVSNFHRMHSLQISIY